MTSTTDAAREQMVTQQIRAWDVLNPGVLKAFAEVPRERFVPAHYRGLAFADTAIPLSGGQSMLTPQLAGRILQALELAPTDQALEVGTGSGFLTACLGRLAAHVTSLEIDPTLADAARRTLRDVDAGNCEVLNQDLFQWQPTGLYNAIAVTGSLPVYDSRLQDWLAPGGRLFVVVGAAPAMEAQLIRCLGGGRFECKSLFETVLPVLRNAPRPPAFRF
jgi:protein-L-isoaspartate(D-aspartate) O-methyltransferase